MVENSISLDSAMTKIQKHIPEPARLEQMAEECTELAQALLKKARKIRGENFTPRNMEEIDKNITEEYTDVILCAVSLGLTVDTEVYSEKLTRWIERNKNVIEGVKNENN